MRTSWKQSIKQRAKTRAFALTHPGTPVPGTGNYHGGSSRGKKLRPYERPRTGGGHKDAGSGWSGRTESGPPIEAE